MLQLQENSNREEETKEIADILRVLQPPYLQQVINANGDLQKYRELLRHPDQLQALKGELRREAQGRWPIHKIRLCQIVLRQILQTRLRDKLWLLGDLLKLQGELDALPPPTEKEDQRKIKSLRYRLQQELWMQLSQRLKTLETEIGSEPKYGRNPVRHSYLSVHNQFYTRLKWVINCFLQAFIRTVIGVIRAKKLVFTGYYTILFWITVNKDILFWKRYR